QPALTPRQPRPVIVRVMAHPEFDATITLNDHHLATAGLSGPEAAAAVRHAVEQMPGGGWIDVEAQPYPPELPGPGDRVSAGPKHNAGYAGMAWHALRREVSRGDRRTRWGRRVHGTLARDC